MKIKYKNNKYYLVQEVLTELKKEDVQEQILSISNSIIDLKNTKDIFFKSNIEELENSLVYYNSILERITNKSFIDKIKNKLNL